MLAVILTTEEKARKSLSRDSRKVITAYDSICRRGYVVRTFILDQFVEPDVPWNTHPIMLDSLNTLQVI